MQTDQIERIVPGPEPVATQPPRSAPVADDPTRAIRYDLMTLMGTARASILLVPGTASAAWETAIAKTLSPGDRVLVALNGPVSSRWAQLAGQLGLEVETIEVAWGAPAPAAAVARRLGADRFGTIKAVFVAQTDPATGVTSDIAALRGAIDMAFHDALLFVDAGASLGVCDFQMDDWLVDIAVSESTEGLAILGVSPQATTAPMRRVDQESAGGTALPATQLRALEASLVRLLQTEGLDRAIARHHHIAEALRRGVAALGLETVARDHRHASDGVTAIRTPEGVDARDVIRIAEAEFGTAFGAGEGPLKDRVFRIPHSGDVTEASALSVLAVVERALLRAGADLRAGAGIGAAQAYFATQRGTAPRLRIAAE